MNYPTKEDTQNNCGCCGGPLDNEGYSGWCGNCCRAEKQRSLEQEKKQRKRESIDYFQKKFSRKPLKIKK